MIDFTGAYSDDADGDTVSCNWLYNSTDSGVIDPTSTYSIEIVEGGDNFVYLIAKELLRTVPAGDI